MQYNEPTMEIIEVKEEEIFTLGITSDILDGGEWGDMS